MAKSKRKSSSSKVITMAVRQPVGQPVNHAKTIWESQNVPEDKAAEWFEGEAERWASWSGYSLESTRGVLSRWLSFMALMNGQDTKRIAVLFGQHAPVPMAA
jgi:hypothetical protein